MPRYTARVGMWAAIGETACTIIYILALFAMMASLFSQQSPAEVASQQWKGIQDYAAHYADNPLALGLGTVVQVSAFASGIFILAVFLALQERVEPDKRILIRISSALVLALVVTSCLPYYVQWASLHQAIMRGGDLEGMAQFAESNASSPAMASLQLGWAFFYGLSTLVAVPAFGHHGIEKWIRRVFLVNGVIGVGVGITYATGVNWVMMVSLADLVISGVAYPMIAVMFARSAHAEPALSPGDGAALKATI